MTGAQIEGMLAGLEGKMPYECRYKRLWVSTETRTVYWVTQESSDYDADRAADVLVKALRTKGLEGWTVYVTVINQWKGNNDPTTKWQAIVKV